MPPNNLFERVATSLADWAARNRRALTIIQIILVVGIVGVSIGLFFWSGASAYFQELGYLGAFLFNAISSATIVLPAPGLLVTCTLTNPTLGLNIYGIAILGALGSTLGETTAYIIGVTGRGTVEKNRFYPRIHLWMQRFGGPLLFALSALPLPFLDLAGILAGTMRIPLWKFYFWVLPGKLVKFFLVVLICQAGIMWLQTIFVGG